MRRWICFWVTVLSVFMIMGYVLQDGKTLEMRKGAYVVFTHRIHTDSTLDTLGWIDSTGIHMRGGWFDSLFAPLTGIADTALYSWFVNPDSILDSITFTTDTIRFWRSGSEISKLELRKVDSSDYSYYSDSANYSDSCLYADSSGWSGLLDGYNEDFFLDTNDVFIDSCLYADSAGWANLLDGYNEDYFRDTTDVWRDSVHAYQEATDSLATPKVKADIIVPKDSTDVDIENLITKDFNDGIVFADKFLSGSMTGGIQEAYDYGVAQGYNRFTIYGATDSSHMNASVNITTNVALELANSTLLMPEDQYIRWLQGNAAGDSVIVDSCDGFQEGWGIAVWDTTGYDAYHVNHMIVDSVDSVKDIIFFTENLDYAVTTAKGAVACHTFNMFQVSVDEGEIFLMRDGKIDGNSENYDGQNAENKSGWISTLISIDAYSGNDDSTGTAIISNCDFKNVPCNGIGIQGEGSIVENCKFDSCGNYAVDIGDNSVIVTNNTFKYCLTAGVFFCTNIWHCRVTENEFKDCATGITGIGVGSDVRDPAKDEYHLLAGNSFLNTGNEAITLGSYSRGIIISENTIENANRDGNNKPAIQAYNCRNVLIENNFITDTDTASTTYINCGILTHRPTGAVSVIGNQIMNWVGDDGEDVGIKVLGDSTQPVNVTQNAIHGTFQYGIYVNGPSVIGGNIIHDDSTDGFIGIEVRDSYGYDDLTLTNNNIRGFDIPINFSAKPANYLFQDTDSIVHSENIITKGLFRLSAGALISVDSFITNWGDTVTSFHTGDMVCDTTGGDTIKAYLNSAWEVK